MDYSLPSYSAYGASICDVISNDFPHYVVSDMFHVENCSQHDGETQSTFYTTHFYYSVQTSTVIPAMILHVKPDHY